MMKNEGFEGDPDGISAWKWRMQVDFEGGIVDFSSLKKAQSFFLFFSLFLFWLRGERK